MNLILQENQICMKMNTLWRVWYTIKRRNPTKTKPMVEIGGNLFLAYHENL